MVAHKMPPKRRPISIDWAESLVGLSMKVPEYWWDNYNSHKLCDGKIDSFDPFTQKWNLLLDSKDDDALYLIAYEAVYLYADFDFMYSNPTVYHQRNKIFYRSYQIWLELYNY